MTKLPKDHVYSLRMNEGQRRILQKALDHAQQSKYRLFDSEPNTGSGAENTEVNEFALLLDVIRGLPYDEMGHPGIIHGLCL